MSKTVKTNTKTNTNIQTLPKDIILEIFTHLYVSDLASVARVNRRFKILVYSDTIYEPKLRFLGVLSWNNESDSLSNSKSSREIDSLSSRLKMLPGGHLLPINTTYLETGTLWNSNEKEEDDSRASVSEPPKIKITAELPDMRESITIGSGGLKALSTNPTQVVGGKQKSGSKKSESFAATGLFKGIDNKSARDTFNKIFSELKPYFLDFKARQRDSLLFRDFKDLAEIATILRKLKLFGLAQFMPNSQEINLSLENTTGWFESMVLGQFEAAYDKQNIKEMRKYSFILYQLNGGNACSELFISKNPLFFDESFNPSLVCANLPSAQGGPQGYFYADEYAKFMDRLLLDCKLQVNIIAQVFPVETDTLTKFVNKVFSDSIADYLGGINN